MTVNRRTKAKPRAGNNRWYSKWAPNHSLERTLPRHATFGRHFILGQTQPAVPCRSAQTTRASPFVKQKLSNPPLSGWVSSIVKADRPKADQAVENNKVRTGQTTNGHWCGVSCATDPDENRTRETHSLAGKSCAALELIGHCPRRSKPVVINACRHAAVESESPEVGVAVAGGVNWRSGRQRKGLALAQHGPGHAGVLGRDGDDGLPGWIQK